MADRRYSPNCEIVPDQSTAGRVVIKCKPKNVVGRRTFGSPSEMVFIKEDGGDLSMIKDGGANSDLIKKTIEHLKKHSY